MATRRRKTANVVIFGESQVGKTCFNDMFIYADRYVEYSPVDRDTSRLNFEVDGEIWTLEVMDVSSTVLREDDGNLSRGLFERFLEQASGLVLLYDVTRRSTFDLVTSEGYLQIFRSRQKLRDDATSPTRSGRFGCVLVGNKLDKAKEKRQVEQELAQEWAQSQGMRSFEVDTFALEPIDDVMRALVRSIKKADRLAKEDVEEDEKVRKELKKMSDSKSNDAKAGLASRVGGALKRSLSKHAG